MATKILDTVLLLALPASGKSEVRKYLHLLDQKKCEEQFHMGPTVQLDDFPYVHMMRRIDEELEKAGHKRIMYRGPDSTFQDGRDWGALIQLINEDHADLVVMRRTETGSAACLLMDRLDAAYVRVGGRPRLSVLPANVRKKVVIALEAEARKMLDEKHANYPATLKGRTLVIEFARGGAHGARFPLKRPYGYLYSLSQLSEAILARASILYVWVTPEESRRKNEERANPKDPGSILFHGVPHEVMMKEYGCDDMDWLEANSGTPGAVTIAAHGRSFVLPVGRFDNRVDTTSFIRGDRKEWKKEDVQAVHKGLKSALDKIFKQM